MFSTKTMLPKFEFTFIKFHENILQKTGSIVCPGTLKCVICIMASNYLNNNLETSKNGVKHMLSE